MTQELHGVISLGGTVIGGSLNQRGLKGETGDTGDKGDAATIAVGTTTTGAAGTNASVTNSGDEHDAVFDFTIPKGDKGETGDVNTYIAEYGTASYADIGDAITEDKYVIAVKDDNYYPLIMFSNSSYVFSYIHENICHEVVCDSYSTWTARTHTSVRDVKQNGASVTTSGVALVTTPQPTTTTPNMDGTASVGSETTWAKGDHVHPSDTTKVDKEGGKGLSANDFTDSLKTKLEGVESGAEVNVQSDWNQSTNTEDDYIKNKPDLSVYAPKEMIKNTLPTDTASGSIASFPDGSDLFDYLSCIVNIEPIQDLHGYDSPWVGGAGKNLCPNVGWVQGQLGNNGILGNQSYSISSDYIWLEVGTYVVSRTYGNDAGSLAYHTYNEEKVWQSDSGWKADPFIIEVTEPIFIRFTTRKNTSDALRPSDVDGAFKIQLELGSTATSWTPYSNLCPITGWTGCDVVVSPTEDAQDGTTYSVSWQTEAGTVYGGKLHIAIVDGEPKTWVVGDRRHVVLDGVTNKVTGSYGSSAQRLIGFVISDQPATGTSVESLLCSSLKVSGSILTDENAIALGDGNTKIIPHIEGMQGIGGTYADDTALANAINTYLQSNPAECVYRLATPTTYQLDPVQVACLLGQNNVFANCGNIEKVQYKADVQKWVEKKLGE